MGNHVTEPLWFCGLFLRSKQDTVSHSDESENVLCRMRYSIHCLVHHLFDSCLFLWQIHMVYKPQWILIKFALLTNYCLANERLRILLYESLYAFFVSSWCAVNIFVRRNNRDGLFERPFDYFLKPIVVNEIIFITITFSSITPTISKNVK